MNFVSSQISCKEKYANTYKSHMSAAGKFAGKLDGTEWYMTIFVSYKWFH